MYTGTSRKSGVSAWLGSTLCLVFDHGKSTLCLVFDGELDILDYIQYSLTGAFQLFLNKTVYQRLSNVFEKKHLSENIYCFWIKQHIRDCPMLLK